MIQSIINDRFCSFFVGNKPAAKPVPSLFDPGLEKRLESLKNRVTQSPSYTLSESDRADLKQAFSTDKFKEILNQIPFAKIKELIDGEMLNGVELEQWLKSVVHNLSEKNLTALCELGERETGLADETQRKLKNDALKSVLETKTAALYSEFSTEIFHFIDHTLNLFIEALGIREINSNKISRRYGGSSHYAMSKLETYLTLFLYPSVVYKAIDGVLINTPLSLLLTLVVCVASLLFLICYDRYLSPCPIQYDGLTNLNMKVKRLEKDPIFARENLLLEMENAFERGKGVLLVGNTRSGKTAIVTALAERIVQKRSSEIIKNAQIFSFNAQSIGEGVNLDDMTEHFNRHEKETIPFIDEIQAAFKENGYKAKSSDRLKTFWDSFPLIIAATTGPEYEQYLQKETAFLSRFKIIHVQPCSPEEVQSALYQFLHFKHPELLQEDGVMAHICTKAPEIDAAKTLLKTAMFKATHLTFDSLEKKIVDLSLKKSLLTNKLLHQTGIPRSQEYLDTCAQLEAKQTELAGKKNQLASLKKMEEAYRSVWRQGFKLAEDPSAKRAWLENQGLVKLMQQAIMTYKRKLGLPDRLSIDLIDRIIADKS